MMAAQSTDLGQRAVHVWHDTHCQMAEELSALASCPSCTSRINWLGSVSICAPDRTASGAFAALVTVLQPRVGSCSDVECR